MKNNSNNNIVQIPTYMFSKNKISKICRNKDVVVDEDNPYSLSKREYYEVANNIGNCIYFFELYVQYLSKNSFINEIFVSEYDEFQNHQVIKKRYFNGAKKISIIELIQDMNVFSQKLSSLHNTIEEGKKMGLVTGLSDEDNYEYKLMIERVLDILDESKKYIS